jgi:hypothetical protein
MELDNSGEKLEVVKVKNLRRSDVISYAGIVRHIYSRSVGLSRPPELYGFYIKGSHPPNHSTFQSKAHIQTWGTQYYLCQIIYREMQLLQSALSPSLPPLTSSHDS